MSIIKPCVTHIPAEPGWSVVVPRSNDKTDEGPWVCESLVYMPIIAWLIITNVDQTGAPGHTNVKPVALDGRVHENGVGLWSLCDPQNRLRLPNDEDVVSVEAMIQHFSEELELSRREQEKADKRIEDMGRRVGKVGFG